MTDFGNLLHGASYSRNELDEETVSFLFEVALTRSNLEDITKILNFPMPDAALSRMWASPQLVPLFFSNPDELSQVVTTPSGVPTDGFKLFTLNYAKAFTSTEEPSSRQTEMMIRLVEKLKSEDPDSPTDYSEEIFASLAKVLSSPHSSVAMMVQNHAAVSVLAQIMFIASEDPQEWLTSVLELLDLSGEAYRDLVLVRNILAVEGCPSWVALKVPWSVYGYLGEQISPSWALYAAQAAAREVRTPQARTAFARLSDNWTGTLEELVVACNEL